MRAAVFLLLGCLSGFAMPLLSAAPAEAQAAASVCPDNFDVFAGTTEKLACTCTAEVTALGSVWGMDVYTGDSAICRAAVHAGVITRRGGAVTVIPEPGRSMYPGVTRNGITSINYAAYAASFRFETAQAATAAPVVQAPAAPAPITPAPITPAPVAAAAPSVCPDDFSVFKDSADPLPCICTAAVVAGSAAVWGMDVYTADSGICRAALHAGAVGRNGGLVTVIPEPGRSAYPGVTRNGVSSSNYGPYEASFRFQPAPGSTAALAAAAGTPPPPSICPDNFAVFKDSTDPLPCICTAAVVAGSAAVWGMDVYTADSGICRAALHAGAVGRNGGLVTVIPEEGKRAYPGVTRNGVSSSNYGPYEASFRFAQTAPSPPIPAAVPAPPPSPAAPVQQPVAATIRATGQVQLYVTFRFNSADLDISAAQTLNELREALAADPSLRLTLIGHTDAVGTPQYNLDLSRKRAQAVMGWLVSQGIAPQRLLADGKGQTQPIAGNDTELGRATNRRVQALRLQ